MLPIVPMFHANAWGLAYAAVMTGASLCMPDRLLQAEPLVRFIQASRPTVSGAVPTVWNDVLSYLDGHPDIRLDSLRLILCGGSAVPVALQQGLEERHGLYIRQAWGMTETSPVASAGLVPVGVEGDAQWPYRGTQGRLLCGVEGRIVGDDGSTLGPGTVTSVGELEVRGPWVTGGYYHPDDAAEAAAEVPRRVAAHRRRRTPRRSSATSRSSDRAKDVIKSGGEWISSVDLENALMGHPDVVEAAVVGIPDEKWQERPLATVVVREGATVTPEQLRDHLARHVREVAAPRRLGLRRPGPAHLGRQVRQEGRPAGVRRGPVRRTPDHRLRPRPDHPAAGVGPVPRPPIRSPTGEAHPASERARTSGGSRCCVAAAG